MHRLKRVMKQGLLASGLARQLLRRRARSGDVPVLMYHGISARNVDAAQLDRHFAFFARTFESRHFSEIDRPADPDRPTIVLTFDDGMRNNFEAAVPLLEKHGLKATFFVLAGVFDGLHYLWNHRLCCQLYALPDSRLPRGCAALDPDPEGAGLRSRRWAAARREVERFKALPQAERVARCAEVDAEFAASGLEYPEWFDREFRLASADQLRQRPDCVEYGSHTISHPILTGDLDVAELEHEVAGSRLRLEAETGRPVETFCFPNGDNDARVREAVARSYRLACTTVPGMHRRGADPYQIRRVPARPAIEEMVAALLGA